MMLELSCVLILASATVVLHAVGTFGVLRRLHRVTRAGDRLDGAWTALRHILEVVGVLLLLHWFEAGMWAAFYRAFELLPNFETAMYFSLTSYTTLGYGDVVLAERWRLLGPFEGAVGILMFGWSTGVMVAAVSRIVVERLTKMES